MRPSGAFYVFPDVSRFGMSSKELASLLLTEAGVAVLPGTDFGERGEGHIRLSYAGDMESLVSGLEKISHTLQKLPVVVDTP
mgnify:CR=1 FL=1|jgi:aspartate/methionine/tyrosine aminotransferase